MDAIKAMAEKKVVDLVVVDSIQAMSPKGEQETKKGKKKSIENDEMALLARKLGKFFRTTSAEVFNAKMAVYLIGQVRMNIGGFFAFADLSGGNALKHWMSLCTYSRRGQKPDAPVKKEKKEVLCPDGTTHKKTVTTVLGFDCVLKMVKSHIGDSVREGEDIHLPFYFETGFNAPKNEITEAILSALPNEKEIKKIEKAKPRPITEIKEMVEESIEDLSKVMNVTEAKKELKKLEEPKKKSIKGANPGIIEDIKKTVKTSTAIEGVNIKEEPKKKRGRGRPKKVKNDL